MVACPRTVDVLEETLTAAANLEEAPLGELVVLFSEGVRRVRLGLTLVTPNQRRGTGACARRASTPTPP